MDNIELLALCVWTEAQNQIDDGKAAVARVILNRMALKFMSDGTITGTVLHKDQFSGFWFDFVNKSYVRVCETLDEAQARAETLFTKASTTAVFAEIKAICEKVVAGTYVGTNGYEKIGQYTVNYLNPKVSKAVWALNSLLAVTIGAHNFYDTATSRFG